jgi:hypothetical protein
VLQPTKGCTYRGCPLSHKHKDSRIESDPILEIARRHLEPQPGVFEKFKGFYSGNHPSNCPLLDDAKHRFRTACVIFYPDEPSRQKQGIIRLVNEWLLEEGAEAAAETIGVTAELVDPSEEVGGRETASQTQNEPTKDGQTFVYEGETYSLSAKQKGLSTEKAHIEAAKALSKWSVAKGAIVDSGDKHPQDKAIAAKLSELLKPKHCPDERLLDWRRQLRKANPRKPALWGGK